MFQRCLLLLLGIAFFSGQYVTLVADNSTNSISFNSLQITSSTGYSHMLIRQAFVSEGMAEEDAADDTENDNNTGIEWFALFQVLSFEKITDPSPLRTLFSHLDQSIETRSAASLVVLHHCWKSFITA